MKNLLLLTGGASFERDVSIKSANNLKQYIDLTLYNVIFVTILPNKDWIFENNLCHLIKIDDKCFLSFSGSKIVIDIILPVVHGDAESGELMGFFDSLNVKYIGSDNISSGLAFDKIFTKRIVENCGVNIVPFIDYNFEKISFKEATEKLNCDSLIVKSARSGCSLGVSKAVDDESFKVAIENAFKYGKDILIEKYMNNVKEIFCSVFLDKASTLSQVFFQADFYTYEVKSNPNLKKFDLPAKLTSNLTKEIQELSLYIFKILRLKYMARLDFFVDENDKVYFSEINTIPGMTEHSSFLKMLNCDGISTKQFVERLLSEGSV